MRPVNHSVEASVRLNVHRFIVVSNDWRMS